MDTLKSTSILAYLLAQNPYHIISIQGSMPMSHAQNTYLTRINGMNTFLLQVNQTPITTQTQVQSSTSTYVPKTN